MTLIISIFLTMTNNTYQMNDKYNIILSKTLLIVVYHTQRLQINALYVGISWNVIVVLGT